MHARTARTRTRTHARMSTHARTDSSDAHARARTHVYTRTRTCSHTYTRSQLVIGLKYTTIGSSFLLFLINQVNTCMSKEMTQGGHGFRRGFPDIVVWGGSSGMCYLGDTPGIVRAPLIMNNAVKGKFKSQRPSWGENGTVSRTRSTGPGHVLEGAARSFERKSSSTTVATTTSTYNKTSLANDFEGNFVETPPQLQ